MWVVSKNKSNCLSENKMVSTLIWRHVSLQWLFSQTFFGLLFCYLTITDVTMYLQIIDFQFPSCCTSQPKKTKPNHYCEQFYEYSYHQKNNSCMLCVPMFIISEHSLGQRVKRWIMVYVCAGQAGEGSGGAGISSLDSFFACDPLQDQNKITFCLQHYLRK